MTRMLTALTVAVILTSQSTPAITSAQTPPDFSGTWALDEARSVSPTFEGFVGPVTWVIKQSPKTMIVDITRGPKQQTLTFRMYDKKPPTGADPEGVPSYRAYWDGDRLVTLTAQNIQGQTVTTREVRTLQKDGSEMQVERIVEVQHGYTLREGQNYSTARDVFRRVVR